MGIFICVWRGHYGLLVKIILDYVLKFPTLVIVLLVAFLGELSQNLPLAGGEVLGHLYIYLDILIPTDA